MNEQEDFRSSAIQEEKKKITTKTRTVNLYVNIAVFSYTVVPRNAYISAQCN